MIKAKTENNLIEEEVKYLNQVIGDLKLNYVEEKNKDAKSESNGSPETPSDNNSDNPENGENTDTNNDKPEGE